MAERYTPPPQEKRESQREINFNRIERLKENLMKLERSVIDEVDEATVMAQGAVRAMGFGISPVSDDDDIAMKAKKKKLAK